MADSKHRPPDPGELRDTRTHDHLARLYTADAESVALYRTLATIADIEGLREASEALGELAESRDQMAAGNLDYLRVAALPQVGRPLRTVAAVAGWLAVQAKQEAEEDLTEAARTARAEGFADIASWLDACKAARLAQAARFAALAEELASHD
jgi:rubrerythrin